MKLKQVAQCISGVGCVVQLRASLVSLRRCSRVGQTEPHECYSYQIGILRSRLFQEASYDGVLASLVVLKPTSRDINTARYN
jgi:hypothetical protein